MYLYCFSSYTSPLFIYYVYPPNLVHFSPVCASLYLSASSLFQLERFTSALHAVSPKAGMLKYWNTSFIDETPVCGIETAYLVHRHKRIRTGRRRKWKYTHIHTHCERNNDVHEDVCAVAAALHKEQHSLCYTQPKSVQKARDTLRLDAHF